MISRWIFAALSAVLSFASLWLPASAQQGEQRIAFVVGNANYAVGALQTPINDAGLVAESLRSLGFDVTDGADLSQADLTTKFNEFLGKAQAVGQDAIV